MGVIYMHIQLKQTVVRRLHQVSELEKLLLQTMISEFLIYRKG